MLRLIAVTGLLAFVSFAPLLTATAQDARFFRIATGSTGGTYFPVGALLAGAVSNPPGSRPCSEGGNCGVPGLIAVTLTTQGSIENVDLLASGDVESGFVQADVAYHAFAGKGRFAKTGPVAKLRAIANLYPEALHVVVRRDAKISKIADLRGKRVAVGPTESGSSAVALLLLKAHGLSAKTVKLSTADPFSAADEMRAGEEDAMIVVAGAPMPAIEDLAQDVPIDLLPLTGPEIDRLLRENPFFSRRELPAGIYPNSPSLATIAVGAQWLTTSDADDELIYELTRALWHPNTRRLLDRGPPNARLIRLETALSGIGIPLHEGALRYYREAGLIDDQPRADQ
jgi:TRAP transporter TAXI family solute receptor